MGIRITHTHVSHLFLFLLLLTCLLVMIAGCDPTSNDPQADTTAESPESSPVSEPAPSDTEPSQTEPDDPSFVTEVITEIVTESITEPTTEPVTEVETTLVAAQFPTVPFQNPTIIKEDDAFNMGDDFVITVNSAEELAQYSTTVTYDDVFFEDHVLLVARHLCHSPRHPDHVNALLDIAVVNDKVCPVLNVAYVSDMAMTDPNLFVDNTYVTAEIKRTDLTMPVGEVYVYIAADRTEGGGYCRPFPLSESEREPSYDVVSTRYDTIPVRNVLIHRQELAFNPPSETTMEDYFCVIDSTEALLAKGSTLSHVYDDAYFEENVLIYIKYVGASDVTEHVEELLGIANMDGLACPVISLEVAEYLQTVVHYTYIVAEVRRSDLTIPLGTVYVYVPDRPDFMASYDHFPLEPTP